MSTVDIGSTPTVSWARGATGGTVTLAVTAPDGTTTSPTVTEVTGTYSAPVVASQAGRYVLRWTASDETFADMLDVWPADPRFLLSFADAVAALRWRAADATKYADDLRLHLAAATEVIEDIAGAVLVRTIEQYADGGKTGVALWEKPDEVLTVEVDGTATTAYVPNLNAGIVYATPYGERFAEGRQNVKITYRVGATTIAPAIRDAVRILLQHMVSVEQGPGPLVGDTDMARTPSGFLVPNRVVTLCETQHNRFPGLA